MKVLVIGGGGREHALAWKLRQSPRITHLYCTPGNGGISDEAEIVPSDPKDIPALVALAQKLGIDLTVVGPEVPLNLGIVDEFNKRGLRIFGPTKAAAQLESSKSFAKEFMQRHNVPTPHYAICLKMDDVKAALPLFKTPLVVKADGLAAGKGVVIAQTKEEAAHTAEEMLTGKILAGAGSRVVLEEFLHGEELSFLVLSDGERVAPLVAAQDHKRIGEGDTGANTGGMGAYSTDSLLDAQMREWLITHVAKPVVAGMKQEEMEYRGILYCGLMMTARGPMVLEFNCRFGDPETQPILMRLESDLLDAFEASIEGRVSEGDFKWTSDATACVVIASGGYPDAYEGGKPITGLKEASQVEGVKIFHAGTSKRGNEYLTSGGRVLGVTARAKDLGVALDRAYEAAGKIKFDGMYYRKDIGARALVKK
jgi:phosphoribosylamine--glycine ligase